MEVDDIWRRSEMKGVTSSPERGRLVSCWLRVGVIVSRDAIEIRTTHTWHKLSVKADGRTDGWSLGYHESLELLPANILVIIRTYIHLVIVPRASAS
jgi:hypothetical protein